MLWAWPLDRPGYGFVVGMHAFGLEENGQLGPAAEQASLALEYNPRDVWAVHAEAHVFEMGGFPTQGIGFLEETVESWSTTYFAIHLWWHLALCYLDLLKFDDVVALYDGPIRGTRSSQWLDVVDAASLLWRLHLFGIDVGDRAETLAVDIVQILAEPVYVFNDWHAVMAAGLAGVPESCATSLSAGQERAGGTNRKAAESAGLELSTGSRFCCRRSHPCPASTRRHPAEGPCRRRQPCPARCDRPHTDRSGGEGGQRLFGGGLARESVWSASPRPRPPDWS